MAETTIATDITDHALEHFTPLVTRVAGKIKAKLPSSVPIGMDELVQWGLIGLLDALKKWDPNQPNQFKTYAEFRIRGAIFDEMRSQDLKPRSVRDRQKAIEKMKSNFKQQHGRNPTDDDVGKALDLDPHQIWEVEMGRGDQISLDHVEALSFADRKALIESNIRGAGDIEMKVEAMQKVDRICKKLSQRDRVIFRLYFLWGFHQCEIGDLMGVTESLISQRLKKMQLGCHK
jgi:RNA polymerase sigma factor for flagellar operon FliA